MQCFISLYFAKRTVGNILINGAIVKQAILTIIAYITSNVRKSCFEYRLIISTFLYSTVKGGDNVNILQAGLPEISGWLQLHNWSINNCSGAFNNLAQQSKTINSNVTPENGYSNVSFNASISNSIYGNSDTVQPPALQLIPQIKF